MSGNSEVVKQGWLQKRGEHIRTWRARYFVLFDCGELVGFRTQPSDDFRDPDNRFTVHGCQIMANDKARPYTFTIRLHGSDAIERHFSVESNEERAEWMSAISSVSALLRAHSAPVARRSGPRVSRRITLDCFVLVKVLGRGTFGKMVLSREKSSGKLYVIKIIKKNPVSPLREVTDTIDGHHVLEKTSHPFLAALRYSFQTAERVCFLMEYANGGDLLFHLSLERSFSEERTRFYAAELVSALGYLHDEGIIYRNLKLDHILLDNKGHIKIANFGLCKANITYGRTTRTYCGTPEYLAPEVLAKLDYGPAVDWWGLGMAMYVMVCGRLPFSSRAHDTRMQCIINEEVRFPNTLSVECRALLSGLLTKEPSGRLGSSPDDALDIMNHPFFASIDWDDLVAKKIPPPFKPKVESETDTRYFDFKVMNESLEPWPSVVDEGAVWTRE